MTSALQQHAQNAYKDSFTSPMPQLDWNATINSIRDSLPQTQFQNWFQHLTLVRCNDTTVVLGVPSRFHEQWLRSNYSKKLTEAIRNQCGLDLQLEFEVLVRDENLEASRSPVTPIPIQWPSKPNLHIVETKETDEEVPEQPGLPPFHHEFIELEFNRIAHQCAQLFAQQTVAQINPLVILGGVGMGKTHLLSLTAETLRETNPKMRIRYVTAETFTAEVRLGYTSNNIFPFKKKYRELTDCLLFDDLQSLAGRAPKSQEELLHVFNEITARGGRVAFTSTVAPQRLEEFIEPLRSRIQAGLIAEIKYPSFDDRVALLEAKCLQDRLSVKEDVTQYLANQTTKDVRELLGTLVRLHLQSKLENRPLDTNYLAQEGWVAETKRQAITIAEIITLVSHNFGIQKEEFLSKSRKSATAWARQVAMYLARQYTLLPLEEIGKTFGRDHATVIHAFQKVADTISEQPTRRYEVEYLKQKLASRAPKAPL
ncbi:MAG: chromosomal replication initiator protein DnaA [Deltaproteobacteria bacterium]|nr:chromosomal replication initiator protein DnaA [Deltaproteobacteria bacterium]